MDKGTTTSLFFRLSNTAPIDFDKANEILFRLGIIYKQQGKYENSLEVISIYLGAWLCTDRSLSVLIAFYAVHPAPWLMWTYGSKSGMSMNSRRM